MNTSPFWKSVQRALFSSGIHVHRVGAHGPDSGFARVHGLVRRTRRDHTLPPQSPDLAARIVVPSGVVPDSRDLFRGKHGMLPCWVEEDLGAEGNWLLDDSVYPLYFRLFSHLVGGRQRPRCLEFGVRTGYTGVVYGRAVREGVYVGVDNNAYRVDGMDRAAESLRILRQDLPSFDFVLLEGNSSEVSVRRSVQLNGPYDIIHVDGDHSFVGKLLDLEVASRTLLPGGLVLVDDIGHLPAVREATAAALHAGWYSGWAYLRTLRGMAVLSP